MIEYNEDHYRELCRAGRVAMEIGTLEDRRKDAVRLFWIYLLGGIVLAVAIAWSLVAADWIGVGMFLAFAVFVLALVFAMRALGKVGQALKLPVLETLAEKGGLTFLAGGFDPPVYPEARKALFGNWLSSQTFSDLFYGTDEEGRRFAFYEGHLMRRSGKNSVTIFQGQMYAWQRRARSGGEVVIVPDRGIFNFFKPVSGMTRVKFESDPEFEKKFEVYAFEPQQAQMIVSGDVRRILLELRQAGRVFGYVGPEDAFVAATGKNKFEPGSMFRSTGGEQRVRAMFDDVCASLAVLKRLRTALS
ncbi:MAG: hypothetical protein QOG13_1727 [Sphingomonadales bacterium]|jgi:hypothetical protein|nr:hypothetical protein [Sphingomonadales bacterium]